MSVPVEATAKEVITDFLASGPTVEEIAAFRLPDSLQEHANFLLERNREGTLLPEERAEMEEFLQIECILKLIKAKAYHNLAHQS